MEPKDIFHQEGELITKFYRKNEIRAKVDWRKSIIVKTGYFRYALELDPRQRFSAIEGTQRELQTVLANFRHSKKIVTVIGNKVIPFTIIPTSFPTMALETPHPAPVPLTITNAQIFEGQPHTMAIGRSYLNSVENEIGDLTVSPHFLICGITSAGKSILLRNMLLSLAARTHYSELKLFLIDLKNEDLLGLRGLPHVEKFAGTVEEAMKILRHVEAEKKRRIEDPTYKPYRLVLALDEMAHLAGIKEANQILGRLASIGRSKWINLVGATQHPTKEGGMGALLKANFTERLVGQVAPGQSQYATNRPGTHAELLPGFGSFLRCVGPAVYRFQSYYMPPEAVEEVVGNIAKAQGKPATKRLQPATQPVSGGPAQLVSNGFGVVLETSKTGFTAGFGGETSIATGANNAHNAKTGFTGFPIGEARKLTEVERKEFLRRVREGIYDLRGKFSQNAALFDIYGSKNPKTIAFLKEALG